MKPISTEILSPAGAYYLENKNLLMAKLREFEVAIRDSTEALLGGKKETGPKVSAGWAAANQRERRIREELGAMIDEVLKTAMTTKYEIALRE